MYQGSIFFAITPEWAGNDGKRHDFVWLYNTGGNFIGIIKDTSNNLVLFIDGDHTVSVSISTWVAGTTYFVVGRWDSKGTLDGTNYGCLSINDVHTFGATAFGTVGTGSDGILIGSGLIGQKYPAQALIQGLTIYRRPLFDGTYGVDVGNGDEINLIYNAEVAPIRPRSRLLRRLPLRPDLSDPRRADDGQHGRLEPPARLGGIDRRLLSDSVCDERLGRHRHAGDAGQCAFNGTSTSIDAG